MKPAALRTAKAAFAPLTSPGGLVQSGGYLGAASIDRLSRPRFPVRLGASGVSQAGAPNDKLPKGMD